MTDAELDARLGELLVSSKALDAARVDTARVYQQARGGTLAGAVLSLSLATDKVVRMLLEEITGIKTVDPSLMTVYPDFLDRVNTLVPAQVWLAMLAFPAQMEVNRLHVCMLNPTDARYRRALESLSGCQVVPLLATEPAVTAALTKHYAASMQGQPLRHVGEASLQVAEAAYHAAIGAPFAACVDAAAAFANRTRDSLGSGAQGLELLAREPVIIRLVHQMIARSVEAGASDIHVEPSEGRLRVRARVDGALRVLHDLPPSVILGVGARLKAMADVPLTAAATPIDARIGYDLVWGRPVDLRFSLVPSISGEKVVMRVLDRARQRRDLRDLGVDEETRALLEEASDLPNGLLLVTGPTGSGKSSTLYALLDRLNTEDECILTAEDPVESRILGVTQVQCDAEELTYAMALKSFLRQDPDVIMVGEVRDAETADIALKAALTGHLVLSSLHTNDAAGAVLRLLNMGLESFIVASSLRLVVAQRLVRRLCKECRTTTEIDVRTHPLTAPYERLHHHGRATIHEPRGCPACGGAGYRGRTGIFEVLRMSAAIEDMVMRRASVSEIRLQAYRDGMRTLREAALAKVLLGETSLAEVLEHTVAVDMPDAVPA
ncbi:type II secretion system protein E [Luteitalea sp. TBR-22]|uniref:GspE/PulE family protein n=1 Tax=Luteitalea sp. TBR-22 TaxID=2802971 RepID=UPI001AF6A87E|nr:GspE/PulE family protein [Luteitalea sp. TBR-22]BCS31121.1 type II secretion system protein E [Luteitalea sp. TBR-22]